MPSHSEKQNKFFNLIKSVQNGEKSPNDVSPEVRKIASSISSKDTDDFASKIAELKIKKAVLGILKDCREPMYLNEEGEEEATIEPVASNFHVKEDWATYLKPYIGQPFSTKELEALNNFKDKKPTTISRTEIWYKTTDTFSMSKTTVIKKMRDSGQYSYTAFQKNERPEPDVDKEQSSSNLFPTPPTVSQDQPTNGTEQPDNTDNVQKEKEKDDKQKDDIIVTKSILFKDDIKGAAIFIEFLKKLEL